MKKINHLDIFKQAFEFSWKKKALWFFGFFIMFGLSGSLMFFNQDGDLRFDVEKISDFFSINNEAVIFLVSLLFAVIFMLFRIVGQASIIKYFAKNKTEKIIFSKTLKDGNQYVGKLFVLEIIFLSTMLFLSVVLFLPVVFLAAVKAEAAAVLVGILAMGIFLPILILFSFVKRFAYIYMVATGSSIKRSIENSYIVFKNNILESLIFAVAIFSAGIIAILSVLAVLILIAIPLFILGTILYLFSTAVGIFVVTFLGSIILAIVFVLIESLFYVFREISWIIFLGEIAGIKVEDQKKEELVVKKEMVAPKTA
ncbi:MAG: hypothetical protein ACD_11C00116G0038 [uncultured bacterium]|nr:MAG: hypothetical protein ACD_11C00116G0038 [uncultured bacterium]HBR71219.1 hypothetical protein [Candidatus Moranbacteria bacterium]